MLRIITATPGSGKTLYIVKMIDELLRIKTITDGVPDAPRLIYSNIDGLKPEMFAEPDALQIFETPQEWGVNPFDWRDTPDGSIIIYDEAQFFFPTKVNPETEKIITEISYHRHQAKDIYCITQNPTLIHSKLKANCGEHIHLYRAFGLQVATKYVWQHFCDNPNSRYEQSRAQTEVFNFDKRYFDYYQSAVTHTIKRYLPKKLKYLIASAALVCAFTAYNFFANGIGILGIKGMKNQTETTAAIMLSESISTPEASSQIPQANTDAAIIDPPKPFDWAKTETVSIAGCAANKKKNLCHCFGDDGRTIQLEQAQCLSIIDKPLPRNLVLNSGGGGVNSL